MFNIVTSLNWIMSVLIPRFTISSTAMHVEDNLLSLSSVFIRYSNSNVSNLPLHSFIKCHNSCTVKKLWSHREEPARNSMGGLFKNDK